MAIITSPKFGKMKNKVDGLVFQKYRTLQVMRDRVIPRNPRTANQQLARAKFGTLGAMAASFSPSLALGLGEYVKGTVMGVRNAFIKINKACVTGTRPDSLTTDYSNMLIAKGSLSNVTFGELAVDNPMEVAVDFTPNTEAWDADADDLVHVFVYCPDLNSVLSINPVKRSDGSVSTTVPATWAGQRVYVWGFSEGRGDDNYGKISNSAYIGSDNIA